MPKPKSSKKRYVMPPGYGVTWGGRAPKRNTPEGVTPMELDLERTRETAALFCAAPPPKSPPPSPPPLLSPPQPPLPPQTETKDALVARLVNDIHSAGVRDSVFLALFNDAIRHRKTPNTTNFDLLLGVFERLHDFYELERDTTTQQTQTEPPPPPPITQSVAVQTLPPPPPITNNVAVQTLQPPKRTYAEAVTQTVPPVTEAITQLPLTPLTLSTDLTAKGSPSCSPANDSPKQPGTRTKASLPTYHTRAIVLHGISTKMHLPSLEEGIEVGLEQPIVGSRWLLSSSRRASKRASSVVIYFLSTHTVPGFLIISGRRHRVDDYEWNRPCKV